MIQSFVIVALCLAVAYLWNEHKKLVKQVKAGSSKPTTPTDTGDLQLRIADAAQAAVDRHLNDYEHKRK